MTTDRRVYVCSNSNCRAIYRDDPQRCPLCTQKGLTWTTYPCPVLQCVGCGDTGQALMRIQYTDRSKPCTNELRACPICQPGYV